MSALSERLDRQWTQFCKREKERKERKLLAFGYNQDLAKADPAIDNLPGRQNKRKGTKFRKLSRIQKNSRRRNRGN